MVEDGELTEEDALCRYECEKETLLWLLDDPE